MPYYTVTTANFTMPAELATDTAAVSDSTFLYLGQIAELTGGGFFQVTALPDATHVTLKNLEDTPNGSYPGNVSPGTVISSGARLASLATTGYAVAGAYPNPPWQLSQSNSGFTVSTQDYSKAWMLRSLMLSDQYYARGGRSNTEGIFAPSLDIKSRGYWRFRMLVQPGTYTLYINVKQSINLDPRPSLTVEANPAMGIPADVTAIAPAGTGFVKCGPVTFIPTATGPIWVRFNANYEAQNIDCYWDNVEFS